MDITFTNAKNEHLGLILQWLESEHVREFWDNSQAHKDDIRLFTEGRTEQSPYFGGIFEYWVGLYDPEPFCLVMTSRLSPEEDLPELWQRHLSNCGNTSSIDFCIGNRRYLGKGLAAPTLNAFIHFFRTHVDPQTDTFLIDPDAGNAKAKHVYAKAGFIPVGSYRMESGVFMGQETELMILEIRAG